MGVFLGYDVSLEDQSTRFTETYYLGRESQTSVGYSLWRSRLLSA